MPESGQTGGMRLREERVNCVLGLRDVRIMEVLDSFRVLSLEQIWAYFFHEEFGPELWDFLFLSRRGRTDGSLSAAYQRMQKLVQSGYLECQYQWGYHHVYRLDWSGYRHLLSAGKSGFKRVPTWPRKGELEHSLLLSGMGIVFGLLWRLRVRPERQLFSEQRLERLRGGVGYRSLPLPDMLVGHRGNWLRFELELSAKSREEYAARWGRLGSELREDEAKVLYVARSRGLVDLILSTAKTEYFPGVFAVELEQFKRQGAGVAGPSGVRWVNFNGTEFEFDSVTIARVEEVSK